MAKKGSGLVDATSFCFPSPGAGAKKSDVSFSVPKSYADSNDVVGADPGAPLVPVNSKSSQPVQGPGFSDKVIDSPSSARRSKVSYGG